MGTVILPATPLSIAGGKPSTDMPRVCVHELFEQQVARDPDAVALILDGQVLSYRELNARANQVARLLRRRDVGPGSLIGVCLARSLKMVIGLLGVWKAGAAYVPLDPDYPPERLAFMVADAGLRLLLTDSPSRSLFAADAAEAVCLDADWPLVSREATENLVPTATPSNLAYVMYTSGSTGQPKGAMILHSGLVNYLCWAIDAYGLEAGAVVPLHSSIAFDLTVTSLYPTLLVGGRVELLLEDRGGQNLLNALRQSRNHSLVKITPAHLELLSQQLQPAEMRQMSKVFVIGGENLAAESLQSWRQHAPATRFINEYGPTETVVGCCIYEVQPGDPHRGPVPIGRPIANSRLYILDADRQPVPAGTAGELYIGGAGVARGYLNRPELTRERFLADPFSDEPEARMYRTGDLARCRDDGNIEYLGRTDDQVKLHGYRIELGEIEARLAAHPGVRACAVLAREDEPGNPQLVAYVVARDDARLAGNEMEDSLKQHLPSYMVPAQFVVLAALPLTRNGKVDRKALPAPSAAVRAARDRFIVRPRTDVERRIAAIWEEVLKVDNIGVDDDFFDVGGRSLTALRVLSRIREAFAVDLQAPALFASPTIAGLAEIVDKLRWLAQASGPRAGAREEIVL